MFELLNVHFNFLFRSTHKTKNGTHPIILRIIFRGERRDIFTGLAINRENWNPSAKRVKPNNKKSSTINSNLDLMVSYDANGNIKTYTRNGNAARLTMDDMVYTYKPNTNQLDKVVDNATDAAASEYDKYNDLKRTQPNGAQGQQNGNYTYDAIGNLVSDVSEGITNISWTVYGKIASVTKSNGTVISYTYDASGNRISKTVQTPATGQRITWYVRDASGNVMALYEKRSDLNSNNLTLTELHEYGSSRLGILNVNRDMQTAAGTTGNANFETGNKFFELSNHLGNVLVTITDKKRQHSSDGITVDYYYAEIASANDYYPFGMAMPGRNFSSEKYRYSINGQEKTPEIFEGSTTALYWEYDSRIGRRWNVDPKPKVYESPYAAFGNNPLRLIDPNGADTIDVKSRTYDHLGRKRGQKGFDEKNMMLLFSVRTHETHISPDGNEVELRREMLSDKFLSRFTLNSSIPDHTIFDADRNESRGRIPVLGILSINTGHSKFSEAVNMIDAESLEGVRSAAVKHLKSRWLSPLSLDKALYFKHGDKYDVKSQLLGKSPLTYVKGVGLLESDYLGNVVYGAIMANFQSLTSSLTDGDTYQSSGYDDVSDSHGIILGHFEGKSKISVSTFQKINRYTLIKTTFIQGKVYSSYDIYMSDSGKELQLKTNN